MEMTTAPTTLPLKLQSTQFNKSIYEKKKTREQVNPKMVLGFISNNLGETFIGNTWGDYANECEQYKKYYELFDRENEVFQTKWYLGKHKWGRIMPSNWLSLSVFCRKTRHSFAKGKYRDIDMKNAHPVIQYYMFLNNGYTNFPVLKRYALEYRQLRQEIMDFYGCDKDTSKKLIFRIAFGGCYKSWLDEFGYTEKIGWVEKLEDEYKHISNLLYAENKHIIKDVKKDNPSRYSNENDERRSIVGLWSQSLERLFQETAIKWLVDNKGFRLEDIIPSQDGFMILDNLYYDGLIEDINFIINDTFKIPLEFEEKPFDEAFEIPLYENAKTFAEWEDELSSKVLSVKFLELYGKYIKRYKQNIYLYFEGRWYDETDPKTRYKLTRMLSENLYDNMIKTIRDDISLDEIALNKLSKKAREMTCKSSTMADIVLHILSNTEELLEDFNNDPYKLGFNNGVFHLRTDEFLPYTENDFITISTGWDYEECGETPEYDKMIEIITSIQPNFELKDWLLRTLASGLDGIAYQLIHLFNGKGGNGKGLLSNYMKAVLGNYYYVVPNGVLKEMTKPNCPSPDVYNLKNKRYIVFSEIENELTTSIIKQLTGGNEISARLLNRNPDSFKLSSTTILEFNNPPDFEGKPDDPAMYRRVIHNNFPTIFTMDTSKIGKTIDGINYIEGNPNYVNDEFINQHRPAFFQILRSIYSQYKDPVNCGIAFNDMPQVIRQKTNEFLENQNVFHKIFHYQYQVVEDKTKTAKLKDMWETFQDADDYKRLKSAERRNYNRDGYYEYLRGKFETKNKNKGEYIEGLEYRFNEDDEYNPIPIASIL
jgi:hypothetical protein